MFTSKVEDTLLERLREIQRNLPVLPEGQQLTFNSMFLEDLDQGESLNNYHNRSRGLNQRFSTGLGQPEGSEKGIRKR